MLVTYAAYIRAYGSSHAVFVPQLSFLYRYRMPQMRSKMFIEPFHSCYLRAGFSNCVCSAVLRGLDLILPRGTITAVVGRSGAGKSTVASLISRFYEPDSGAIWLGGRPATDFTRGEWAKAVALVSQEPVLFSGTPAGQRKHHLIGLCC